MSVIDQVTPTAATVAPPCPSPRSTIATVRAVTRHGLRDQRRSMLIWGLSFGVYGAFMASIYPSISDAVDRAISTYPEALKQAFQVTDMSTVEGYIQAEMFSLIVPLALAFFACRSMMRMLATAEERGDLDVVLALPLSRRALVAGAALTTWITTLGVLGLIGLITWLAAQVAGSGMSASAMFQGALGVAPLALFGAGIATVACGRTSRASTIVAVAMGAMVGMYVLDLAARLADSLQPLRYASVFHYYGAPLADGLDAASFAGLTLAAAALTVLGAVLLDRRDLR